MTYFLRYDCGCSYEFTEDGVYIDELCEEHEKENSKLEEEEKEGD